MNNKVKFIVRLSILALAAVGLLAQVIPVRLCCITGEYNGSNIHKQLPNCPPAQSETFSMTVKQGIGCTANVWGTILSPSGEVQNFTGTLARGLRGCCVLTARFGTRPHVTTFTGTFCLRGGKWQAKGTYSETGSSDPCKQSGTWEMKQI